MRDEPIFLAPYDPAWPRLFEEEGDRLTAVLRPWLVGSIEHIGSTAVAGLIAKPIIDIMAGVRDLEGTGTVRDPLKARTGPGRLARQCRWSVPSEGHDRPLQPGLQRFHGGSSDSLSTG